MAQTITFDEVSELASSGGSVERALQSMAAALQNLGDAGAEARSVLDSLRKSLQSTAAQSVKSARSLAKFDEINRLAAPETEKTTAKSSGSGSKKTAAETPDTEALTPWQQLLQTLQGLWAQFWAYLQSYYAPAIAAWQAAWAAMQGAAAAVWEPLYLATEFLPGVVNSFSQAFAPIVGGAVATAITVLGNTFTWLCGLVSEAVTTVVQPALALLLTLWQDLMTGIQTAWASYGQPFLDGVVLAFQNFTDLLQTLWGGTVQPVLTQLIDQLGALWSGTLNPLWQQLTLALGAVMNLVLTLWNTVLAPLAAWLAATFAPVFTQAFAGISSAVTLAVTVIGGAITTALAVLRGLADFVNATLRGDWDAAWNAMSQTVQTVWDTITRTIKNAADALLQTVTNLAGAVGSALSGILSALSGVGSVASGVFSAAGQWLTGRSAAPQMIYAQNLPVPALASGAVIPPNRAFLALLGDQHSGTNIEAPLATIEQAVAGVMADLQAGQMAGFETLAALLRELVQAVYGIELTDEMVGRAAQRWTRRSNLRLGGELV